jgi:phenylalanyl-tRNA synthetase alpha chain
VHARARALGVTPDARARARWPAAHAFVFAREEVMTHTVLGAEAYRRARSIRDLSDPAHGPHALQLVVDRVRHALGAAWRCPVRVHRDDPVVAVADNYDRLGYAPDAVTRDARYSRYVTPDTLLRTHTTAMIPPLLRSLAAAPPADVALLCPGMAYRRDAIDRLHTGEPHQLDVWRVRADAGLTTTDLRRMVGLVVDAVLPGARHRCNPTAHPYTTDGLEIEVASGDTWVEIGECGLARPEVLRDAGLDATAYTGLAMGLGLDRLAMLAKGIDDIRLLRSTDPRVATQMLDLAPYRPVSRQPAVQRDLSVAVADGTTAEDLGDRVREALGPDDAARVESVVVLGATPRDALPPAAVARLGMRPGQTNVLLRVTLRDLARSIPAAEANRLRNAIYTALHEGDRDEWAA